MDLLEYALAYTRLGWSIIPLHHIKEDGYCSCGKGEDCDPKNRGKHPAINTWLPYQKDFPDEKKIRFWFTDRHKNIGIVTGKLSKLLVVDYDGIKAQGIYERIICDRINTIRQKTGGGTDREQDFFLYPEGMNIKNATDLFKNASGVDIRAEGGYVVAPPSITKNKYEWIINPVEMGLNDLCQAPKELLQFIIDTQKKTKKENKNEPDWQNELLMGVCEPGRNTAATRLYGWWLLHLKNKQAAFDRLYGWNQRNKPPLTDAELRKIADSINGREGITCLNACSELVFDKVVYRDSVDGHGDAVIYFGGGKKCIITGKEAVSYRSLRSAVFTATGEYLMPITEKIIAPIMKKVFNEAERIEKPMEYSAYSTVRHVIERRINENPHSALEMVEKSIIVHEGNIYLSLFNVIQQVENISKKITRGEIIDALIFFGFEKKVIRTEKKQTRIWTCKLEKYKKLIGNEK